MIEANKPPDSASPQVDALEKPASDPLQQETLDSRPIDGDTVKLESTQLGNYEIIDEIARGGMGVVYRARQVNADRVVALKLIRRHDPDPNDLERFEAEYRAAAKLDHPNIVPIYDVGMMAGEPFFTMKWIDGLRFAQELDGKPIEEKRAARILRDIASGVAHAHSQGIIHRDLKPGNILLDKDDQPLITEFGLAKFVDGVSDLTRTGEAIGTPAFMPPEQASGDRKRIDERSDVYSLGAVLYSCLTGRPPFQAANAMATTIAVMRDQPVSPRLLNCEVPRDLETICLKCLDKSPASRYPSATEFCEDIDRYLRGVPVLARPIGWIPRTVRWSRRNSLAVAIFASLLIGMIATSFFAKKASDNQEIA